MERVLVLEGVTHRGAVRGAGAADPCNLLYACTLLHDRWQLLHSGFTFQLHCSTIPINVNAITVSLNVAVNQLPKMHTVDEAVHLLCLGAQGTAAYCCCPTQPYCSTPESFSVVSMFAEFLTLYRHSSLHCAFHRFICQYAFVQIYVLDMLKACRKLWEEHTVHSDIWSCSWIFLYSPLHLEQLSLVHVQKLCQQHQCQLLLWSQGVGVTSSKSVAFVVVLLSKVELCH